MTPPEQNPTPPAESLPTLGNHPAMPAEHSAVDGPNGDGANGLIQSVFNSLSTRHASVEELVREVDTLTLSEAAKLAAATEARVEREEEFVYQRKMLVPALSFIATCLSVFYAGFVGWNLEEAFQFHALDFTNTVNVMRGLHFTLALMGILVAHEMGHFLMTIRHRIPASFPFFIPFPNGLTGTMGAVISMDGSRATRRQLFDIGIAGPLAGLVVIIPVLIYGLRVDSVYNVDTIRVTLSRPMLVQWLVEWLHPNLNARTLNPWIMAGWVGCLITGLNMFPLSQLDGGHVAYCLFRRNAHKLSRIVTMGLIAAMILNDKYMWVPMLILVIIMGIQHPRTANDNEPLGLTRRIIGVASLSIPILCFISQPVIMK